MKPPLLDRQKDDTEDVSLMRPVHSHPVFVTTVAFGTDGVVTVDDNLVVVQFNPAAELIFGHCASDVIGKPLTTLLYSKNNSNHKDYINRFFVDGDNGGNMAGHRVLQGLHANGHKIDLKAYVYRSSFEDQQYYTAILQHHGDNSLDSKIATDSFTDNRETSSSSYEEIPQADGFDIKLLGLSKTGILEHDHINGISLCSNEVFEILELDRENDLVSETTIDEFIHPEDREVALHLKARSIDNQKHYQIRHRLLLNTNKVKYIERRCETYYDKNNNAIRTLEVIQDLNEHFNNLKEQCHLRNLLLRTEKLSKTGSWELNLNTGEIYLSPEYFRLHNMDPVSETSGIIDVIADSVHPDDRTVFINSMHADALAQRTAPLTYRVVSPENGVRVINVKSEEVKTNKDNTRSIYGFAQDVTEFAAAEKRSHKSSELLRAVIDTTHVCIAHLDCDLNFVLVNKAYADTDNKTPEYFIGKNHFDLYPHEENEKIFRNALKTGQPYSVSAKPFEYANNPERGITHWDWTVTPVKDSDDTVSGLVLALVDVTERVQAIESSKRNEEKLAILNMEQEKIIAKRTAELEEERNFIDTVLDNQGVFVTVVNYYGHIVLFNRTCESKTGYHREDIFQKPLWEVLVPSDEKVELQSLFDDLLLSAAPSCYEGRWISKNGEDILIEWSNSVIRDNDGTVRYVVMTGIDITESRRTERLLKRASGNLLVAQMITKIGCWEYEVVSKKLWWSEEYYSIFGLEPDSVQPDKELYIKSVHPEDLEKALLAMEQLIERGYKDVTLRIVTPDGDVRVVHEIAQVEYNKHNEPHFLRGTLQDITDITKAEAERNQLQRQLQQAHKMESIGQLTGGIAHDFNNILAAILGFTRLALTRFGSTEDGRLSEYLLEIEKAGQRASSLVKQMLAFSRGDTQDFSKLDPVPVLKESITMLRSTIPPTINIITELPEENVYIQTNALQLQQSIINLIINSRDALNGKGNIYINARTLKKRAAECVSCHKLFSGEYLAISVRDTGSGIRPDLISRIFEPFFTTKPVGDGTGMGLAMVHGFLHSSSGHIEVDVKPGQGTEVTLYFPIHIKEESIAYDKDKKIFDYPDINSSPEHNIIVVDDETAVTKYFDELLSMHNYDVTAVNSSPEALELIKSNPDKFDLLITDQAMPELNGEELITEAKKLAPELPVILCSGYSDLVNKENYKNKGADFYLAKPINQDILLQSVKQLVNKQKNPRFQ